MIRRPPRSTLFPTRRSSDLRRGVRAHRSRDRVGRRAQRASPAARAHDVGIHSVASRIQSRSEEHTSELQSRRDLVCRLLLEKKKTNNTNIQYEYTNVRTPCK